MLKQFLLLFVGAFCICLFVLMMQFVWRFIDDLIGKGLSMDVLAQFFWYMALMLVPQALPLAILLASLITMGNLGESMELTAIKAAGIPLVKCTRALICFSILVAGISFIFQNDIGPKANSRLRELMFAMRQKSPELEIPEGIFYNGIPNCNLYVQKKDMETGVLYGVMIYRMTGSFEDAAIILADSGRLQSTADKQHLKLSLYNGEWFENLRSQEMGGQAEVPYRRESFIEKVIILNFNDGLNLGDGDNREAGAHSVLQLTERIDSMKQVTDSMGTRLANELKSTVFHTEAMPRKDSLRLVAKGEREEVNLDTLFARLPTEKQRDVLQIASQDIERVKMDMEFRGLISKDMDELQREFAIERINKFTLSFTVILFFFIGASLGAIIRKGGLGVPIIISVLVYILFFILDNTGFRMARQGSWTIAFGKGLSPAVLTPLAIFFTYKANKDSVVMNIDAWRNFFMRLLGMRFKRHISSKEVIINDPDYQQDAQRLSLLSEQIRQYSEEHHLISLPNPINVFFKYVPDNEVEHMSDELEAIIDNLGNTRDRFILGYLNQYPIVSIKAHTRPFDRKWLNILSAIIFPVGAVLYIRMCRFRLRLYRDLKQINNVNTRMIERINAL
ncbi:MAG: LptF/LptG family permease [Prevotella sp.]|nr:LptF/LptG family permease [Prevotella sp.]